MDDLVLPDDQLGQLGDDFLLGRIHLVGQRDVLRRIHDDRFLRDSFHDNPL
jgi:hypothetical protein